MSGPSLQHVGGRQRVAGSSGQERSAARQTFSAGRPKFWKHDAGKREKLSKDLKNIELCEHGTEAKRHHSAWKWKLLSGSVWSTKNMYSLCVLRKHSMTYFCCTGFRHLPTTLGIRVRYCGQLYLVKKKRLCAVISCILWIASSGSCIVVPVLWEKMMRRDSPPLSKLFGWILPEAQPGIQ